VIIHASIHGADEHWRSAYIGVSEFEMALCVRLRIRDRLHASLKLNQDYFNASGGLPIRAVANGTFQCPGGSGGTYGANRNREPQIPSNR
jgi:hypothetical protein